MLEAVNPELAWLGLLALVPIILYLIRRRVKVVEVSTLVFFKTLAREHQESSWLRKLKRWLSFLMSLALILGAVLSLMRVVTIPGNSETRNVVVLLDRSASMGAAMGDDRTRMEEAQEMLATRLKRLSPRVMVSLVTYDERPEVLLSSSRDLPNVVSLLQGVEVQPLPGKTDRAAEMALALAAQKMPAEIWCVSDHEWNSEPDGGPSSQRDIRWRNLTIGTERRPNVGITAFQLRPLPLQRARQSCFLEITCNGSVPQDAEADLRIQVGSARFPARKVSLGPGKVQILEFPIEGISGQEMHLKLELEEDCLAEDDEILIRLPEVKPIVVVRVGPRESIDPYTHVALQSLVEEGELQAWSALPEQWPLEEADVVLFDHWLPDEWPEDIPVIVMSPPASLGPLEVVPLRQRGIPQPDLRILDRDHPVLFRVSSDRLSVLQTCVLDLDPGIEPLWVADQEPVLAAGERDGQRIVVMGFSPHQSSQLPLTGSFPLLIGNSIYWCAGQGGLDEVFLQNQQRTGTVLSLDAEEVRWTKRKDGREISSTQPVRRGLLELSQSGIWESGAGDFGSAHLLSQQESQEAGGLPPSRMEAKVEQSLPGGTLPRDLSMTFLFAVLLILFLESLLFHRFAVY